MITLDEGLIDELRIRALNDPHAMEELLAQLRPLVLQRCTRMLPCGADAEEASQDALLAIATRLSSFSG